MNGAHGRGILPSGAKAPFYSRPSTARLKPCPFEGSAHARGLVATLLGCFSVQEVVGAELVEDVFDGPVEGFGALDGEGGVGLGG